MEEFTYEQIRAKALKQGVKDNKFTLDYGLILITI